MDERKWNWAPSILREIKHILSEEPMAIIDEGLLEGRLKNRLVRMGFECSLGKAGDYYLSTMKWKKGRISLARVSVPQAAYNRVDNSIDINAKYPGADVNWSPRDVYKMQLKTGSYVPNNLTFGQLCQRKPSVGPTRDSGFHGDILDVKIGRVDAFCFVSDEIFYLHASDGHWQTRHGSPYTDPHGRSCGKTSSVNEDLQVLKWDGGVGEIGPGFLPDLRDCLLGSNVGRVVHFTGKWTYPHAGDDGEIELHGVALAVRVTGLEPVEIEDSSYKFYLSNDHDDVTYRCKVCEYGAGENEGKSQDSIQNHWSRIDPETQSQVYPSDFLVGRRNLITDLLLNDARSTHVYPDNSRMTGNRYRIAVIIGRHPENCRACRPIVDEER